MTTSDPTAESISGPTLATRMLTEAVATCLFFAVALSFGIFSGALGNGSLAIGLIWGFAVIGAIIGAGHISGAHMNPAVTVGAWLAGRFPGRDVGPYAAAQLVGGLAAGAIVYYIAAEAPLTGHDGASTLATLSIGYGEHSPAGFAMLPALLGEATATALLVTVVLAATARRANAAMAPLVIGLVLAVLVMWAMPFTNAGLNPARATATAVWAVGGASWPLSQLWAFWLAPLAGASVAGLLYRRFGAPQHAAEIEILEVPRG